MTANLHTLYRDRDGNWCRSTSFGRDDLLLLGKVAIQGTRMVRLSTESSAYSPPLSMGNPSRDFLSQGCAGSGR